MTLLTGRDFDSNIALTALPTGDLMLPELVFPERSKVVVERSDVPLQYRLTLPTANISLHADVNGAMRFNGIARLEHPLRFATPKSVAFKPQAQQVVVDLTFIRVPQKIFPTTLAVQDLSLLRIDDQRGIEGLPPARRVSTIISGTLYFEELNGRKFNLRPGEMIELDGFRGVIESLQLREDIRVKFRGHIRGIASGPAGRRSLMPTWLEWLKARQGLSLLWGSAVYLFGLAATVLRWLRGAE